MAERGALWQWLIEALTLRQPVALLVVVDSVGSSPGKIGAKMAVSGQSCAGTIGGGAVESGMINIARSLLSETDAEPRLYRRVHHPEAGLEASGMICGGEQTVLLYPCRSEDRHLFVHCLEYCRQRASFGLSISASGLRIVPMSTAMSRARFEHGEHWRYQEALGMRRSAYIIGAGHVGLALSRVLDWLDFDVTVIDEREQAESMPLNGHARQKWRIPYSDIAEQVPDGPDVFVFVMTHHYSRDELVLARLARKQFAYLGVLGSRHKVSQLKASLANRLSTEQLARLRAPMGLPINSHTPEEIAVSIAAEIIQLINCGQ